MQETASEVYGLVRSAGAKLADHWPNLVTFLLAGFAAKLVILKLSLLAGKVVWPVGVFLFAFTAAALLVAIVQMFRSIFPGHPWPRFTVVLAPFLLVFLATDHFDGYRVDPALERPVTMDITAASVLIVVIAARWLLPLWKAANAKPWAKRVKLGLDICWMSLVAFTITTHPLWQWLASLSTPVSWLISTAFTVLIVPLCWLAVGALVMGFRPADGLFLIRRAGVLLTLVTCLIIVLLEKIPSLFWEIERLAVGARDPESFWLPVSGFVGATNTAISVLLIVAFVAALLSRLNDQPGVARQGFPTHDAHGDRLGVGGRHEVNGQLIGI